jgi:hypothetical protein
LAPSFFVRSYSSKYLAFLRLRRGVGRSNERPESVAMAAWTDGSRYLGGG